VSAAPTLIAGGAHLKICTNDAHAHVVSICKIGAVSARHSKACGGELTELVHHSIQHAVVDHPLCQLPQVFIFPISLDGNRQQHDEALRGVALHRTSRTPTDEM
jgi:hypothetical protein